MDTQRLPLLILVSGKPGAGKSTLARRLAAEDALWLPLVSCDPIRVGLLETDVAASGRAVISVFYGNLDYLLDRGVSLIAELSFRRGLDESQLRQLADRCRMVNIHCLTTIAVSQQRFLERQRTRRPTPGADTVGTAMESGTFDWSGFEPLALDMPRLCVDATAEYAPELATVIAFCRGNDATHTPVTG